MVGKPPKNFSWLEEGKIAALAFPDQAGDLQFLVQNGIGYLVTLTRELKPQGVEQFPELVNVDISVDDFSTFTLQQVEQFIEICERALQERKVARYCWIFCQILGF